MKPYLILSALVLLTATACKKDGVDALPAATRTGQNTGGCLINGKAFVAKGWPSGGLLGPSAIPPLGGGFAFDSVYYVRLYGQRDGQDVTITLFLRRRIAGTYLLNQTTLYYPQGDPLYILNHATYSVSGGGGEIYTTDAQHTGQVQLTYMNRPISAGTFEFTAASTFDPSKTITLTDGRFDRKQ